MQKVYCVFKIENPEEQWLMGICSSQELAEKAIAELPVLEPSEEDSFWPAYFWQEYEVDNNFQADLA